jgi:serine protease Do
LDGRENPFKGTPFEDFFNEDLGGTFRQMPQPRDGVGSGVIVDSSGIVLTNNHVVDGADEVVVRLHDGREFKTTDIKVDPQTDLAVLRIEGAGKLPAARLGDSSKLEIGEWVIAVGNPFQLETTVSAGIISAKGRSLGSVERSKFLQTDAAINPGNSGGPLVNLDGEVVGINTAIASNNGSYQGIGFAIPSDTAKWVMTQLIEHGSVQRAYLGVTISLVEGDLADAFGIKRGEGVLVTEVFDDTPASKAGLKEGDVITHFANVAVSGPRELQEQVERAAVDSKHTLRVLRDGKPMNLSVTVKPLPEKLASATAPRDDSPGGEEGFESAELGMEVSELTANVAEQLGYTGFKGVVISNVEPESLADRAGLREGTLVLHVGNKPVQSVEAFKAAVKDASLEEGVLLLVRSGGANRFVVLKTE